MNAKSSYVITLSVLIIVCIVLMTAILWKQEEKLESLEIQHVELLAKSRALDVKINQLKEEQDSLEIPIISPSFIEWWENEQNK